MAKKILIIAGIAIGLVLIGLIGLIVFLSVTEFKPADREECENYTVSSEIPNASNEQTYTVYSWNIGYAGLGEESDFFMDGGKMVDPPSQEIVEKNLAGITAFMQAQDADAWLLQEVDVNSARTAYQDQFAYLRSFIVGDSAFAYNYKCPFVPIPVPPLGRIESGIATISNLRLASGSTRISLPCPFSWPVRAANMKRCLLMTRLPIEGSDKELVLVNLHLEAYDDGEGKIAQTKLLLQVLQEEYAKGNYVVAGGDFNQSFSDALKRYPIADSEKWTPGLLDGAALPEGWQFAYDTNVATCRLLDQPYSEACQLYVIDGFILSPNVTLSQVETVDLGFACSDHNPVRLQFTLE